MGPDDVPVTETDENRALLEALREVIDPEIGINIVDLGLVYAVERRGKCVDVVLTMTTPACPLSAVIEEDVRDALLERVAGVEQVCVAVIFEPPWSPEMISERARTQLGG
ncbi:MAG: metal-sulfur cluster assembly factor [Persicimonas sp.]